MGNGSENEAIIAATIITYGQGAKSPLRHLFFYRRPD